MGFARTDAGHNHWQGAPFALGVATSGAAWHWKDAFNAQDAPLFVNRVRAALGDRHARMLPERGGAKRPNKSRRGGGILGVVPQPGPPLQGRSQEYMIPVVKRVSCVAHTRPGTREVLEPASLQQPSSHLWPGQHESMRKNAPAINK